MLRDDSSSRSKKKRKEKKYLGRESRERERLGQAGPREPEAAS